MMSILPRAFSVLRPSNEQLSYREEDQIQLCRLFCLLGAVLLPVFGILHQASTPGAVESTTGRIVIGSLFAGLFLGSYVSTRIRQNLHRGLHALFYGILLYAVVQATANNFAADDSAGLLSAFAVMIVVLGTGTQSVRPVLWFAGTGLLALTGGIFSASAVQTSPAVLFGAASLIVLVEGIAIRAHQVLSSRLKEREERLHSLAENVSEGMYRSTPDRGILYASQALVDMFGYESEQELAETDPEELYAEPAVREDLIERATEHGGVQGVEVEYQRKDGSTFIGLLRTSQVTDDEGTIRYYDGSITDITAQKRTENQLREQRARLRGIANSIPGVVFQFYVRPDGTYGHHFVSDRAEEMLGISSDPDGFHERVVERIPPSYREALQDSIDKAVQEEKLWRFEAPFKTASGDRLWLLGASSPERRGDELVFTGVILDITERKKAQQELERTKEKFEQVFENSNDAILITDVENNRFVDCNQAAADLVGVTREKLLSMTPSDLHPHNYSTVKDWFKTVFDEGSARTDDITCRRVNGDIIPIEASAGTAEFDGTSCLVTNVVDITDRKKRGRALRDERDRLQTLFQNLPTPVLRCTVTEDETRIADVNTAFENVFGIEAAEAEGTDVNDLLVPDDRRDEAAEIEKQAFEEGRRTVEVRRQAQDGMRHFRLQAAGRTPENGPRELYAIYTDITERKERERELRRRERRYQAIFEDPQILTALLRPDGTVLDVNQTAMEYVDVEKAEVTDRPFWETAFWEDEMRSFVREKVLRAADGEYVEFEAEHPEREYITIGIVRPVTNRSGEVVSLVLTGRDITERKRREQEIERTNAILRAVLENLPVGLIAEDTSRNILVTNERLCELFDIPLSPAALEGRPCMEEAEKVADLFADPGDFLERIEETVEDAEPVLGEEFHLSDGRVFEQGFVPYDLPKGEAVLWIYRDITEQKVREKELMAARDEAEEASRAKSSFLANMSHEIRTPLTSIIGFAEAIGDETEQLRAALDQTRTNGDETDLRNVDFSPLNRFARLIEEGGHRLLETLNGVLNLSKLEAGEMALQGKTVDVTSQVEATAKQLRPQAQEKNLTLTIETPSHSLDAKADEGGIQIVVRNLISNAIKYTDDGGRVWTRAWEENDEIVLEVEDTGIGMAKDQVPDLFEAFRQESEGTGREYEGTGLGLTLTKRLLEKMDGSIDVETEKGTGTRFTVRLPKVDASVSESS